MTAQTRYDILIIGGGQAGIPLAHALAKAGKTVALAERKDLGGSCVNFGCTPTKAVIASARAAFQARRGAVFGLRIPTVEIDFPAVLDRARSIVMESRASLRRGLEGTENPKLLRGHARLTGREADAFRIRVGKEDVLADRVVLNTGTRALRPPIAGLEKVPYIHAGNWLDHHEVPRHLVFVGAGYVALEMSQFYRRMGSLVTVIDKADADPEAGRRGRRLPAPAPPRVRGDPVSPGHPRQAGRADARRRPPGNRIAGGPGQDPRLQYFSLRGPAAQHRRPRSRDDRRQDIQGGLRPDRRAPGHERPRSLRGRRHPRRPDVHAHVLGRLPRPGVAARGRRVAHDPARRPVCRVHGPGAGAGRDDASGKRRSPASSSRSDVSRCATTARPGSFRRRKD